MLVGCLIALTVGTAMFFVVDRYRLHLIPCLAILTAIGLDGSREVVRMRAWHRVTMGLVVLLAALVLVIQPLVPHDAAKADWDYATTLGEAWLAKGNPTRAVEWLQHAAAVDERGELGHSESPWARLTRAGNYDDLASAQFQLGANREALA